MVRVGAAGDFISIVRSSRDPGQESEKAFPGCLYTRTSAASSSCDAKLGCEAGISRNHPCTTLDTTPGPSATRTVGTAPKGSQRRTPERLHSRDGDRDASRQDWAEPTLRASPLRAALIDPLETVRVVDDLLDLVEGDLDLRHDALVALLDALEAQEVVIGAARPVRTGASDSRARVIDGAAAGLPVEEGTGLLEDHILDAL